MKAFCACFGVVLCLIGLLPTNGLAHEKGVVPCAVDVIFGDDDVGVFTAFILKLQYKNTSMRVVRGVSVLIQDKDGEVFKNSDAVCNIDAGGLVAGDTGQCEKVLQIITGKMSKKVGYDVWVDMIDDQKAQLLAAKKCEIAGVQYQQ
ncbi:hypothetical protein N9W44_06720 [Alphaproteobacteria bacterium]|jgi:hypothetical protein|nr:hypothetical protein [Alphaproteobacteria bacterium]